MSDTLKARLERLQQLKKFGEEFSVEIDERGLSDVEVKVLKEFYREDSLAHEVARGTDSYRRRIEPILEKYSPIFGFGGVFGFWRGETLGQEVKQVVTSMNNVGEGYANPEFLTLEGRKKVALFEDYAFPLVLGGGIGLGTGVAAYSMPDGSVKDLIVIPTIFVATLYVVDKVFRNWLGRDDLNNLRNVAQRTDEFLRQHYVKPLQLNP